MGMIDPNLRHATQDETRVTLVIAGQVFSLGPKDKIEIEHITHGALGKRQRFELRTSKRGPYTTKPEE